MITLYMQAIVDYAPTGKYTHTHTRHRLIDKSLHILIANDSGPGWLGRRDRKYVFCWSKCNLRTLTMASKSYDGLKR
jgi:hypothetical protein